MALLIPKLDILPPPQRTLWNELKLTPKSFVLYGGTALALRLGHRQSEDFDFFSTMPFNPNELLAEVPFLVNATVLQCAENTLTCMIERGGRVKLSFFGGLNLLRIEDPDVVFENGVRVASLIDLAGCKMGVVQQRAEAKDYLDIAAILRNGVNLQDALAAAKAVYGPRLDPRISLRALTSFDEGNLKQLDALLQNELRAAVSKVQLDRLPVFTGRAGLYGPEQKL